MAVDERVERPSSLHSGVRLALAILGVVNVGFAVGFAFQLPWALTLIPWDTGRLSYLFVGSIFAAIAAGVLWIAASGEAGSMPAGFLNLTVTLGGTGAYVLATGLGSERGELVAYGVGMGLLAAGNLGLFWWTRRFAAAVPAALPRLVRGSFVAFTAVLLAVGTALILQTDGVMPWPLDGDTSALIGWIFFGNAFYFLYGAARGRWDAARAQLWSFLAYDVVLIGPLLAHYADAPADLRTNVIVYAAVLVYSGALAVYYLLLNPTSRGWSPTSAGRGSPASTP